MRTGRRAGRSSSLTRSASGNVFIEHWPSSEFPPITSPCTAYHWAKIQSSTIAVDLSFFATGETGERVFRDKSSKCASTPHIQKPITEPSLGQDIRPRQCAQSVSFLIYFLKIKIESQAVHQRWRRAARRAHVQIVHRHDCTLYRKHSIG